MRSTKGFFPYGAGGIAADAVDAVQAPGPLLISLPHQNDLAVPGPEPIAILPGSVHIQLKLGVRLPVQSRRPLLHRRGISSKKGKRLHASPEGFYKVSCPAR